MELGERRGNKDKGYYDSISSGYRELYRAEQVRKLMKVLDRLAIASEDRVLDVGCGDGYTSKYIDCDYTGLEPSRELIEKAPEERRKNIKKGTSENMPFSKNTFDVVLSITAVQNFNNIRKGVEEMRRVGKERFGITVLKKSRRRERMKRVVEEVIGVEEVVDGEKDIILLKH